MAAMTKLKTIAITMVTLINVPANLCIAKKYNKLKINPAIAVEATTIPMSELSILKVPAFLVVLVPDEDVEFPAKSAFLNEKAEIPAKPITKTTHRIVAQRSLYSLVLNLSSFFGIRVSYD